MSIIDDTIKRLGDEHTPLAGNPPAPKSGFDPMPELGFVAGSRQRYPASFLLALALAVVGVVIYFLLPGKQSPSAPAKVAAVVSAPAKPIATAMATATASAPSAVSAVAAQATVAQSGVAEAAQMKTVAAEAEPQGVTPPPSWYDAGWSAANAGKWPNAFSAWEDGVRGLPKDRMVIAANSYADLNAFSATLKQYVKMFPSIGMRQRYYNGQMVYRVLIFPYGGGTREILPRVQGVFSHAGLVNASYVQARMAEAKGIRPAPDEAAKAGGKSTAQQAVKAETSPVVAVDAAKHASGGAVHLAAVSRMPADSMGAGVSGVAGNGVAAEANTWENRASAVREQLKAEAYAEVVRDAQALARDFPDRWESWFWLGTAQLALGQMDAADTALERANKLNPKIAQVWVQRAIVAQERGDHAAAVRLLTEARELSPKSPQIYLNLGYSNDALGLLAEAEKNYLRFLSLTEGDSAYLLQRKPIIERLERTNIRK